MDCIDILSQTYGHALSEDELLHVMENVKKERKRLQAAGIDDVEEALRAAATTRHQESALAELEKKRTAILDHTRHMENLDFITTHFNDRPQDGLDALISGSSHVRQGARDSVEARQNALAGKVVGGFAADLQASGHLKLFTSNAVDKDIARALSVIDTPGKVFTGPPEAMDIALIMRKWQDKALDAANEAGASIKKRSDYIIRQSHDRAKIHAAGFQKWRDDTIPWLDMEKTLGADFNGDVETFLYHVWEGLASGEHLKHELGLPVNGGSGSTAKRLAHERVLIFKDADAWMDYNKLYGMGSLREGFLNGLVRHARATGLMQVLGPGGSRNWETLLGHLKQHYIHTRQQPQLDGIRGKERTLRNRLKEVDGTLNIPGSDILASWGKTIRITEDMAKLGEVLISSFSDIPLYGAEFAHQGYGFFSPIKEGLINLAESAGRKSSAERTALLSELGVAHDSMIATIAGKYSGDEIPGRLSNLHKAFFKLNLLTGWTDAWRESAVLSMSHGLYMRRGMSWNALDPNLSRTLSLYGIDEGKWNIIRMTDTKALDGKGFVTPEGIHALPDEVFAPYLSSQGITPTANRVQAFKTKLESQLRAYFKDRVDYAVLQPDSKTRATLRQGTSAGTWTGEALRFFAQFKSFPTSVIQRVWGREVYGRGADSITQALSNDNGELANMARLVLSLTLFGYASSSIKQLIKGRNPRPLDAEHWHSTLAASFLQGGALGVYGDFLFGEFRRSRGGSLAATLGGPALSSVEQIADIAGRVKEGDSFAAASLRTLINHVPGNNLFYIRPVFDHAIGYELFEMLSPGYINRTIERARKEHGQEFWLRPGDASLI